MVTYDNKKVDVTQEHIMETNQIRSRKLIFKSVKTTNHILEILFAQIPCKLIPYCYVKYQLL
jgi:hypothetical protein